MFGDQFGAGLGMSRADSMAAPGQLAGEPGILPLKQLSPALFWMLSNPGYYPYFPDDHDPELSPADPAIDRSEPGQIPTPSGRYMRPGPSGREPKVSENPAAPSPADGGSALNDTTASDAGQLPYGYHLAQSSGNARRPFAIIGPTGRDLTIPQWLRWQNWNSGTYMLRQLDPKNPMLQSLYGPNWIPDVERDIAPLYREIGRLRAEQRLKELELHHALPNQFDPIFQRNGISSAFRDSTGYYMWRNDHRGRGGLHPSWNRDWKTFLESRPLQGPGPILENLEEMLEKYDQWYGW
jgi:hypothetical protein